MSGRFACTVAIPAHDGLPDVIDAVTSALDQSLPPAEIVVVDDDSRDGTGDAVARAFGDRVRLVRGRFGSAGKARNAAWRAGTAPWVAFLDADDLWSPEKLDTAAARLSAVPEASWFFSDGAFRTLEGETRPSWMAQYGEIASDYSGSPLAELVEVNFILTSSVVARRDRLEALGGFREDLSHAEDLDLWIRLARSGTAAASPRALVRYQHRPGGLTRQTEARLEGNIALFERLAADPSLGPALRRGARHRVALAHYKLAVHALREGRTAEARRHLPGAWLFPERAFPVALAAAACLLPAGLVSRLRRQSWATRPVVAPLGRHRRVVLRSGTAAGGVSG
jgi:GT2 family glycosyltransferase